MFDSMRLTTLGVLLAAAGSGFAPVAHGQSGEHSVARQWNEITLESIRNDFARPVVHARNLFWHAHKSGEALWCAQLKLPEA